MRKVPEQSPASFVRAPLPDQRLLELWSGVERGEARAKTRKLRRRGAAALLGVASLMLLCVRTWSTPAPVATVVPASTEVSAEGSRRISLAGGSALSLLGETRAHVVAMRADEVRVRVEQGTVECEVAPDRGRRFVVEAGAFEVVVTGTRFTVSVGADERLPTGVVVKVERGSVEVWQPSRRVLASLEAGQLWASERSGDVAVSGSSGGSSTSVAAPAPAAVLAAPPRADAPSARTLFARASSARLAGNAGEAAAALEELRRRYPSDERAGYAAFMLGRLRLDTLGDAPGAVEAFEFAVAHPGSGFFLEDAEARRVEALAKAGRAVDCRAARARFLQSHPNSPAAALVAKRCEER